MSPREVTHLYKRGLILSERSESKDLRDETLRLRPTKQGSAQGEGSEKLPDPSFCDMIARMLDHAHPEVEFAVRTVREASRLARQIRLEIQTPGMTKGDRSPVTVADFAIQALLGHELNRRFPGDALVAEENATFLRTKEGGALLDSILRFVRSRVPVASRGDVCEWIDRGTSEPRGRFWVLDPIDGTKGFLRGDQYAVALALIENGEVRVAALGCPMLDKKCRPVGKSDGCLVVALSGRGTWRTSLEEGDSNFVRLRVSERKEPAEACFLRSFEPGHADPAIGNELSKQMGVRAKSIAMDSQAKHAVLAAGIGDVFFYLVPKDNPSFRMKIWDVAPGFLVVREAGGKVTDLLGQGIDFTQGKAIAKNPGLLITNGHYHPLVLELLRTPNKSTSS